MQTILGSGGAIGTELARALRHYTGNVRLVSRNPTNVSDEDETVTADLLVPDQVAKAVEGSEICYLTVGLAYSTRVWRNQWPLLIRNVVDACARHGSKLVFFDNVYAIGGDNVKRITEDSPASPTSRKGEIRVAVERQILEAVEQGRLSAIIARAPDFFGPIKHSSALMMMVYDNLVKHRKAQWFCNADAPHSMGYAPDLAAGTALLGNSPDAFNQIWNLPVDNDALTGRQWVELFASLLDAQPALQVFPAWSVRVLGLFIPVLRESAEMLYQYDRDYYFDSSKFKRVFGYVPKSNGEAVRETLARLGHRL